MTNPMLLVNKRILMIGENTGIDDAIYDKMVDLGASVVKFECPKLDQVESHIKTFVSQHGAFDGVVFTIVHSDFRPLQFVNHDSVISIMNDNYGLFVEIMRCLKKSKGIADDASIVALSSISSTHAMKAKMAFCASKAALDAAVRCLAVELGDKGIRVNSIQKGGVDVDLQKTHIQTITEINNGATEKKQFLGLTQADEIANLAAFLLSDATSTLTGTAIVIDGGYTL